MHIDNPTHHNAKREREKGLKALEVAKKIPRKVVFLKRGVSGEELKEIIRKPPPNKGRKKKDNLKIE